LVLFCYCYLLLLFVVFEGIAVCLFACLLKWFALECRAIALFTV